MITFEKDANYTLDISYTDMAGNVNSSVKTADSTAPFRFTVDKTPPAGTVTAFSAEGREETWDKTVDRLSFGFWSNQRIDISLESHDETSPIEYVRYYNSTSSEALDRISLDKIKEWKDFGGLIMYDISAVMNMIGAYIQKENTVIVKEINPDELTDYSVTLFKNNEPEKLHEQQGDINKDYNMEFVGSDGEWHGYTYTINQGNFSDEGNYDVRLYSVDKAGNISQNTLKDKNGNINFAVDKKPPTAELINLKDNTTYVESSHKVLMTADDNIKLESIKVYLDDSDRIYCAWNSDEIERSSGDSGREFKNQYSFDIAGNTTDAHTLRIICKDASGRETQLFVKNFYVTTNPIIPFMKNYGWIIAAAAISITVGAVSLKFKKKKQNH